MIIFNDVMELDESDRGDYMVGDRLGLCSDAEPM